MNKLPRLILVVLATCAALPGCRSAGKAPPRPPAAETVTAGDLDTSIRRGVEYLLASQNRNGSWGSATQTKDLNIYAPIPGAHHGFRAGTTGLCVSALLEAGGNDSRVTAALDRAEAFLLSDLPRVRRAEMDAIYNIWAHAYGAQALAKLLNRPGVDPSDEHRNKCIRDLIALQVTRITDYEFVGGGWGYYDFEHHLRQPGGDPNSFTTATVLLALRDVRAAGVEVPQRLIDRGLTEIRRQSNPNGTYHYSRNWWVRPVGSINRAGGSLGRSQACNAALRVWGEERITDKVLTTWLNRLFARNGWLDIGRKRPIPHESWFAVAGYFYYYGHYHGALCIEMLPAERQPFYQDHMARTMMQRQEKDGSWFDYPLYAYHKPYGTAYALMSLQRCRKSPPTPSIATTHPPESTP